MTQKQHLKRKLAPKFYVDAINKEITFHLWHFLRWWRNDLNKIQGKKFSKICNVVLAKTLFAHNSQQVHHRDTKFTPYESSWSAACYGVFFSPLSLHFGWQLRLKIANFACISIGRHPHQPRTEYYTCITYVGWFQLSPVKRRDSVKLFGLSVRVCPSVPKNFYAHLLGVAHQENSVYTI